MSQTKPDDMLSRIASSFEELDFEILKCVSGELSMRDIANIKQLFRAEQTALLQRVREGVIGKDDDHSVIHSIMNRYLDAKNDLRTEQRKLLDALEGEL